MDVTVTLSEETAKFLHTLFCRMESTDRRCTADPFFIQVRSKKIVGVPDDCGICKRYFSPSQAESYSFEDVTSQWAELCEDNPDHGFEDFDEFLRKNFQEYDYDYGYEEDNVFLTIDGYNEHMKLNGHNYRHYCESFSYVKHAFRNPEMDGLIKSIREIGGALKDKYGGLEIHPPTGKAKNGEA